MCFQPWQGVGKNWRLQNLLERIEAVPSADGHKDDLRAVIVAILDELGVDHPLSREARRRLAAALY